MPQKPNMRHRLNQMENSTLQLRSQGSADIELHNLYCNEDTFSKVLKSVLFNSCEPGLKRMIHIRSESMECFQQMKTFWFKHGMEKMKAIELIHPMSLLCPSSVSRFEFIQRIRLVSSFLDVLLTRKYHHKKENRESSPPVGRGQRY